VLTHAQDAAWGGMVAHAQRTLQRSAGPAYIQLHLDSKPDNVPTVLSALRRHIQVKIMLARACNALESLQWGDRSKCSHDRTRQRR
jgi:hypothetical protein